MKRQLTQMQIIWLNQRGGRVPEEVVWIDELPYVMMKDGNKEQDMAVRVPDDKDLWCGE